MLAMTKKDLIEIDMGFVAWQPYRQQIPSDFYYSIPDNFVFLLAARLITEAAIEIMIKTEINNV